METEGVEVFHSRKSIISYSFGAFISEFLAMAFSAYAYFYYETEVGLNSLLCGLAFIIYAVWNAVNDPLIGYLTDRPFRFTKKWGRRFPWIIAGGIPWIFSYILIFTPPEVNPESGAWILFGWLTFTICMYDTFATVSMVNYGGLFPDKFRSAEERRKVTGTRVPISVFGTVFGAILPPLFITFGNKFSYVVQAGIIFLICIIALILLIPGSRDDQECVDRYLEMCKEKIEKDSFFSEFKIALKQRSFMAYIIVFFGYQIMIRCMTASIPYSVRFILKMEASAISFIMLAFLLSVLISVPIWVKVANKLNDNRKVMIITGIFTAFFVAPLIFIADYTLAILTLFVWGLVQGGFWAMLSPVFADTVDESVIETGERREGLYSGFVAFFARLAIAVQAFSFAITHILTGFVEGSEAQSDLAVWGIHVHLAVIPLISMLLGVLIFWKFYEITPDISRENQLKIQQLKL
jgi:GPH family glycoside/pentoside/hexuronide:cation symporter